MELIQQNIYTYLIDNCYTVKCYRVETKYIHIELYLEKHSEKIIDGLIIICNENKYELYINDSKENGFYTLHIYPNKLK